MKGILFLFAIVVSSVVFSQNVGINATGTNPDNSAMLDVSATNKGLLIPRVALTASNAAGPIATPATSLLVYNTATAGTAPNNVTPGFYFWDGNQWVRMAIQGDDDWYKSGGTDYPDDISNDIYSNGNIGIGINNPTAQLHIEVPQDENNNPNANGVYVYNADNAGDNGDAIIAARTNGANGGDPFISFDVEGVSGWSLGMDNSDSDKLKFSNSWNTIESNTRMTIEGDGDVGISTNEPEARLDVIGATAGAGTGFNDSRAGLIVQQRHGAEQDILSDGGSEFVGPTIDLRTFNGTETWTTGEIRGLIDYGSANWGGGMAFLVNPGGTSNPDGRRTRSGANLTYGMAIEGNGRANFPNGIQTQKRYYYFQRYVYNNSSSGADQSITENLGAWDFCAVGHVGFKNNASSTDEDDDVQCAVYPEGQGGRGEQTNYTTTFNHNFNTKPTWTMYLEAYEDTNGTTCAANCINFDY